MQRSPSYSSSRLFYAGNGLSRRASARLYQARRISELCPEKFSQPVHRYPTPFVDSPPERRPDQVPESIPSAYPYSIHRVQDDAQLSGVRLSASRAGTIITASLVWMTQLSSSGNPSTLEHALAATGEILENGALVSDQSLFIIGVKKAFTSTARGDPSALGLPPDGKSLLVTMTSGPLPEPVFGPRLQRLPLCRIDGSRLRSRLPIPSSAINLQSILLPLSHLVDGICVI
jgi:hypothetical protein